MFVHAFILEITCPNPRVLENGEVIPYQERYFINDVTTYSCNSDYKFRGSKVRVCQPNGKWNGSTPVCGRDCEYHHHSFQYVKTSQQAFFEYFYTSIKFALAGQI